MQDTSKKIGLLSLKSLVGNEYEQNNCKTNDRNRKRAGHATIRPDWRQWLTSFFSNFITNPADNPARNWPDLRPDSGGIVPARISFEISEFSIFGQIFEKL